jgi:hypothetical protein
LSRRLGRAIPYAALFAACRSAVIKTMEHRARHAEADLAEVAGRVAAAEDAGAIGPWEQGGCGGVQWDAVRRSGGGRGGGAIGQCRAHE